MALGAFVISSMFSLVHFADDYEDDVQKNSFNVYRGQLNVPSAKPNMVHILLILRLEPEAEGTAIDIACFHGRVRGSV